MKILYLRTLYAMNLKAGGSVGHTAGVINAMRKLASLSVISNDALAEVQGDILVLRPWVRRFVPIGVKELLCNIQFLFQIQREKCSVDFIYQRHAAFSFVGAYLSHKYDIPLILEFNSSEVWKMRHWQVWKPGLAGILQKIYHHYFAVPFVCWAEAYNLRRAGRIVVVSDVLKDMLMQRGIAAPKILVNPNGVDTEKFSPGCGGDDVRRRYGLADKTVVGFIGTFGQWHGIEELARAVVRLTQRHPHLPQRVKFLLIGDGILLPKLKEILHAGDAEDAVIFTGLIPQHEAPRYLDACDIFISPHIKNPDGTKFFGSPTKLFEYMAMERGIVASDLDQIGEILTHGETAHLVPPGDVEALADGICRLIEDVPYRVRLGKAARQMVLKNYTWEKHVERILQAAQNVRV